MNGGCCMGSGVTGPYDLFQGSSSSIRAGHPSHVNAVCPYGAGGCDGDGVRVLGRHHLLDEEEHVSESTEDPARRWVQPGCSLVTARATPAPHPPLRPAAYATSSSSRRRCIARFRQIEKTRIFFTG